MTRRFPTLKVAFLEGGVAFAADLYASIVEAWEKRNIDTIMTYLDPKQLAMDLMVEMFGKYGNDYLTPERMRGYRSTHNARDDEPEGTYDEFKACEINRSRTSTTSSCPISISAAKPTTGSTRSHSTAISIT